MFWLLCPSLSHASYYGIVYMSTYLYEAFPTVVSSWEVQSSSMARQFFILLVACFRAVFVN